jgi:AhpD family alkylhydroperoxidase
MSFREKASKSRSEATALFKAAPEPLRAFQNLMKVVGEEGALSSKTKELMALAIAVATRCEDCIIFHVQASIRHHATREEVLETIAVAIEMSGGPGTVYGGKALAVYDELSG